jgi:uncharacterized protein YecT (DUF1311 family)
MVFARPHMRVTVLLISLLVVLLRTKAAGNEQAFQCRADGNQQEMNACAFRDHEVADRALNQTYKELMSELPEARQRDLRQQQRAWLKKRDSHCWAEAKPSEGGSIWPFEYYGCLRSTTERRTKELQSWRVKP